MQIEKHTKQIKDIAYELGFMFCGVSKADFLTEEAHKLEKWLQEGKHGKMQYMENHFDMRLDPRLLVPSAKSVVSLIYNYFPSQTQRTDSFKISKYAYGQDYHFVLKEKLKQFLEQIRIQVGEVDGRVFVDSAPVMDKAWAKKAGLGWVGKNSNLIHPKKGSFFFIAELIIDLELTPDGPIRDYCGTCTKCIDACPTDAIVKPYVVDGSKCISYLTIELKDEILPKEFANKMNDWVFGCDICQDVCPWNRFSNPHTEPLFQANENLLSLSKGDWKDLSDEFFNELFKKSAVKRTKKSGLMRNITFLNEE
ncbi:MAG: tRNA epoxyqueuosine(34) reductase QueG [Crocinitomicaceae bacterium]|nr:tRNA epoxyqueuosine(34) reductase QueG [Crocinitomicaceae bacterium]